MKAKHCVKPESYLLKEFIIVMIVTTLLCFCQNIMAEDIDNCLLCHKYSGLGMIDASGKKHLYYVNQELYNYSVHGKIYCRECHDDIDKFPHPNAKKVDCTKECHLQDPSTGEKFSHATMIKAYDLSVHGKRTKGQLKDNTEDLPDCTYCHENRIYQPVNGLDRLEKGIAQEILDRCLGCHENELWARFFYDHFTHRLHQRRSSKRMVALCTKCHEDEQKMSRHGLKSVSTFRDTFHWQALKFENPNAPNCITCHAPVGYFSHEIMPKTDPRSAIYKDNLVRTCSNLGGLQQCHPDATASFAQGKVHPIRFKVGLFDQEQEQPDTSEKAEKTELKNLQYLLAKWFGENAPEQENPQYIILYIIKYFYMLLIGGLISFMIIHQVLDFFATRRAMRKEGLH